MGHFLKDDDEVYLFPGGLGIYVRKVTFVPGEVSDLPSYLGREAGLDGSVFADTRSRVNRLPGNPSLFPFERRLLTFVVVETDDPACVTDASPLLVALTGHARVDAPDGLRPEAMKRLCAEQGLALFQGWSVLVHRDNASAVLIPDRCRRDAEGGNATRVMIEEDFFRIFVLEQYARLWLHDRMERIVASNDSEKAAFYEAQYPELLEFRNWFWFREVSRNTSVRAFHRPLHHALGLDALMAEVDEEMASLRTHWSDQKRRTEEERERRLQQTVAVLTVLGLPLSIVTGFFGMNVIAEDFVRWVRALGWLDPPWADLAALGSPTLLLILAAFVFVIRAGVVRAPAGLRLTWKRAWAPVAPLSTPAIRPPPPGSDDTPAAATKSASTGRTETRIS